VKIRIIGSCGSGKSTLAKKLSEKYDIPYDEIDNIIWDRSSDNLKYPEETRDATLKSIVGSNSWILEGVQYKDWTLESIEQADIVLVLNPHVFIRDYRIIKRFVLSRTGIRPWNYKQTFRNLCKMIVQWNHRYDVQAVADIIKSYDKTPVTVKNTSEAIDRIDEYLRKEGIGR
jgi:adenylate kinase family enzyme